MAALTAYWPCAAAVAATGLVLALIHIIGGEELRQTLAGADVCSTCGQPYEAGDDVITPHECRTEVGF